MKSQTYHLVIRFSDNLFGVGKVAERHNELVSKYGYVWFGKLGSCISVNRIELLAQQIGREVPTFVYLVKGTRKKSEFYRASLYDLRRELPEGETEKYPSYYDDLEIFKYMNTWFKVGEICPVDLSAIKGLRAINSVYSIQETLALSSSGYFLVHEVSDISY